MSLKSINPIETKSWSKLKYHFNDIKEIHINEFFTSNSNRANQLSITFDNFHFDFSKNKINSKTISLFEDLLTEIDLKSSIEKYFGGEKINSTELRSVLHTALRSADNEQIMVDGKNIVTEITKVKAKVKSFSESIISGNYKGFSGKKISDVVNIGIGGSDLGPSMVVESLSQYKTHLNTHFISNVDGDHVNEILNKVNPEEKLLLRRYH